MQMRRLGNTDLHLTTIGFGAWAAGGPWQFGWGPQDDNDSIAAIQRALDLGINWIDTAPAYGLGHSEEVVGQAIRGRRDQLIVATKCGRTWDDPGTRAIFGRLKRWSVRQEAEASLRRLGVDTIDLYQVHWPRPDEDIVEAWEEIARLVSEGKVRYAGVSNFNAEQIRRLQPIHPVASLQPPYNFLERDVEQGLLQLCAANGIGVVAYSPMASGLLTGKYTLENLSRLAPDDWRRNSRHFQEPELRANLGLVDRLRLIARRHGRTPGQLAVAWVLRRPEITAAIVGGRNPEQVAEIAPAGDWTLGRPEIEEIEAVLGDRAVYLNQI